MAALARREDSVVAALGELKGLEAARRKSEVDAAQRALDAQLAREREIAAEARRVADDTERRLADEARHASMRAEAEVRAQRLVAIEAEARARAGAEIALVAERQAQELAIKRELAQRSRPRWLIGLASVLAVAAIALGMLAVARGGALDDARVRADGLALDLAGTKARVTRLEADLDKARATIAAQQMRPTSTTNVTPTAPVPPKKPGGGHGGHHGGGGDGDGGTPPAAPPGVIVDQACIDAPLGCPTK